ncbi:IS1 family transposase [Leptolyngbya boryana CZ1]|uniref:IS1 transposase n=2 Tax=Leptolyngbya boryana TaxID=1184 RepID=A0A1Z4JFG4_LEPBY|nr:MULTISPECIES: IS1 family transposase [Leptolyngbya]BAY55515.1 IS1 transposase [Leptolyngbya boryana NIES-2135]MBD1854316.1 IS1 family transposase [Leptolyngbya sp. FACHB-1624]MBD2368334.1 IS1 family transposase [Leptolyngbya sp. FACHB-161]MBD2375010.1 IS1 family transposase [Leptolyngbya sp. FACHB-238]MBD2399430.1 IS1 family transposase [Leptolyngbya sp. FACHB-239]
MKCPSCGSTQINKNGHCRGKQNYRCKSCGRQFVAARSTKGYSDDAKQICLKMYRDGIGFRAIERTTGVSHNTIINWVKQMNAQEQSEPDPPEAVSLQNCANSELQSSSLTEKDFFTQNYEFKSY